jgi:hypothetical protein
MNTSIRYFIIDPIDDCVLATTRDHRVAQALSAGFLDSKLETLHDGSVLHKNAVDWCRENYDKFETQNVRLGSTPTFVPADQLTAAYQDKKRLAIARRKMLGAMYLIADSTNYSLFYDNFFNHESYAIMSDALEDANMLKEYASCVNLPVAEAEKEIRLKVQSRKYSVIKLQGHIDRLVKEINSLDTVDEVMGLYQEISFRITGIVRA